MQKIIHGKLLNENTPPQITNVSQANAVRIPGQFNSQSSPFFITTETLSKHTLLVGGTGSGKTNLFYHIVRQLKKQLTNDDVMLIFDSKGDFHKKFCATTDVVIGNSAQYRKISDKWSIYHEIIADGKDKISVAQNTHEICRALFAEHLESGTNPFFPNAACDLLASVIIALVRNGTEFNNEDLKDTLDSYSPDQFRKLLGNHKDLTAVAAYIEAKAKSQAQGVLSELYTVVRQVLQGVFADVGDFSMRQFIRQKGGKTAFIEYDLSIGDTLAPIYTILFDLALKEGLGRTASKGNVYLIADELKLLPNLRHLEDGINFGRSLGVKILAGLQSIDQLNANYSDDAKARNAIAGFSSIFAFQSNDFLTREHVSKLFGKNIVLETFSEASGQLHYETRGGFTVEDWDLTALKVGEAIVGLPDVPPFKYKFDLYVD
ncbi:MAG: type IV secretion system DNA-binding domain-containing protein [Firmicutes bacterium]|nr:type IV secretion system DNA-binding domain-containing protein [Bacillota bacterium]